MSNVRRLMAESAALAPPEPHVASWYTQGRSDGLGDRLLMFDNTNNTNTASLELLRLRSPLAATMEFEQALRERVIQLGRFDHPAFPAIRAVEHLDDGGGLALVSTHVPGRRLSEMFHNPQPRGGLHPAFVTWLIRQLAGALAALQSEGEDVFHGALGADRVIVSAEGHLLIAEHVLGSALQGLRLTPSRLSHEFGILAPGTKFGVSRLDVRTDVVQLGLTALSVLLGRQITLDAYQQELEPLLVEFSSTARQRSPFLAPPLRLWLERALQLGNHPFRSASDAYEGLTELPETTSPRGFSAVQSRLPVSRSQDIAPLQVAPAARLTTSGLSDFRTVDFPPAGQPEPEVAPDQESPVALAGGDRRNRTGARLALGFAVIAVIEAGVIGLLLYPRFSPSPQVIPIPIESPRAADVVLPPAENGAPPAPAASSPDSRTEATRARDGRVVEAPAQATPRLRSGGVRLVSPIELQVFENERFLGSSASGPIVAPAGVHELELVNIELGYRTYQRINITEGQIVPLTITPPAGRVSITAVPWAQVWIDGRLVGETPLAGVSIAAGEHTITFRHPELGERRETVTVRPGAETWVTTTLRQ